MRLRHIPLYKIVSKGNVRFEEDTELADLCKSIETFGVLQPVLVRPIDDDRYELISGHRRFEAMKALNEPTIPAYIRPEISGRDVTLSQIVENTQRKQMSAAECVEAFDEMKRHDPTLTNSSIGRLLGRNREWVTNQYVAVTYAGHLLDRGADPDRLKKMSAGKIIAEAQRSGVTGKTRPAVKEIKVRRTGAYTVNVVCPDEAIADKVVRVVEDMRGGAREENNVEG